MYTSDDVWYSTDFTYNKGDCGVDKHPRFLADVNGDGKADIVGFADDSVKVALSDGTQFLTVSSWYSGGFTYNKGDWRVEKHVRLLADVNGDGTADIVGFVDDSVQVALSDGAQFQVASSWYSSNFTYSKGDWRVEKHPRTLADVDGDGTADIVGFANWNFFRRLIVEAVRGWVHRNAAVTSSAGTACSYIYL